MVSFPVYVRDDAGDVRLFHSLERMQSYLEQIDIENSEYEAWDSVGTVLMLQVRESKEDWLKITKMNSALSQEQFSEIKSRAVAEG